MHTGNGGRDRREGSSGSICLDARVKRSSQQAREETSNGVTMIQRHKIGYRQKHDYALWERVRPQSGEDFGDTETRTRGWIDATCTRKEGKDIGGLRDTSDVRSRRNESEG